MNRWLLLILAILFLGLAGCSLFPAASTPTPTIEIPQNAPTQVVLIPLATPTLIPLPGPAGTIPPAAAGAQSAPASTLAAAGIQPGQPSGPYAVILVETDDALNIRLGPGAQNPVAGNFAFNANNIMRTGPSALAEGATWVEVERPGGGVGWVNARYLTRVVSGGQFCADPEIPALFNALKSALNAADGKALAALVSPLHGLDVRFYRQGTNANYSPDEASWVFQSDYVVNWGAAPGSGLDTLGTFREVPLPKLLEVLNAPYQSFCNDPTSSGPFSVSPWPDEYRNINFLALHKPGAEQYGGLDFRTWLAGVEYVGVKPYLFALIFFQWEP
jgi:hypothetical protein